MYRKRERTLFEKSRGVWEKGDSCWVYVNSRWKIEQLGNCFGPIILIFLFSESSQEGALLIVARRTAQFPVFGDNPDLLNVSLVEVNA